MLKSSAQTSWFHLLLVVVLAGGGVYAISQALYKPMVNWQTFNEVRAAEIHQALEP